METRTLRFRSTVAAPAAEVYRMFTNSTALREWLCETALADRRKGGRLFLGWNSGWHTVGEFKSLLPGKGVAFTWRGKDDPGVTSVRVSFSETGGKTRVSLAHAGVGTGRAAPAWDATATFLEEQWPRALENLQSVMETGHDLRFTRRPMLGIYTAQFDPASSQAAAVSIKEGVLVGGSVEGMGARAAGLVAGDVIVGLARRRVRGPATLTAALAQHQAGDTIKVTFYRGADKKMAPLVLSGRSLPQVPPTADALAEALRRIYTHTDAQLESALESISEEVASRRPGPQEWGAKEVICHLLAGERDLHAWIANLIGGEEAWWDGWAGNVEQRYAGTLATYPTLRSLLEELKCAETETVGIVAALPAEFVAHKSSYWRVGHNLLSAPDHIAEHLEQIRAALGPAAGG